MKLGPVGLGWTDIVLHEEEKTLREAKGTDETNIQTY